MTAGVRLPVRLEVRSRGASQVGVTMEPRWRHAFDGDPLSRSLATLSCLLRSRSQGHFTPSL